MSMRTWAGLVMAGAIAVSCLFAGAAQAASPPGTQASYAAAREAPPAAPDEPTPAAASTPAVPDRASQQRPEAPRTLLAVSAATAVLSLSLTALGLARRAARSNERRGHLSRTAPFLRPRSSSA